MSELIVVAFEEPSKADEVLNELRTLQKGGTSLISKTQSSLGTMMGAGTGALAGALSDYGIDDNFEHHRRRHSVAGLALTSFWVTGLLLGINLVFSGRRTLLWPLPLAGAYLLPAPLPAPKRPPGRLRGSASMSPRTRRSRIVDSCHPQLFDPRA